VVSPASEKRGERKDVSLSLSLSLSSTDGGVLSLSLSSKQGKERHDVVNDDDVNDESSVSRSIEIECARARRKRERERRFFWCVFLCCAVFWSTRNGKKSACRMRNYIISFSRAKPFDDDDDDDGDR
jgi:hypothetical protein